MPKAGSARIVRLECAARVQGEPLITLHIDEAQCVDLAHGFVPRVVKANALGVLDLLDGTEDRRRAARPEPKVKKRR